MAIMQRHIRQPELLYLLTIFETANNSHLFPHYFFIKVKNLPIKS